MIIKTLALALCTLSVIWFFYSFISLIKELLKNKNKKGD